MNRDLKILCEKVPWMNRVQVAILDITNHASAEPVVMKVQPDHVVVKPFITLEYEQAQELMDELWRCGLRPAEGAGSAGSLTATEKHLQDVRKIAFGLLKKHGVEA